ncbi:MAG: hypothetical protein ACO3YY_10130 [Phycisphaerales bacterium]|jgi:hypothetical protein
MAMTRRPNDFDASSTRGNKGASPTDAVKSGGSRRRFVSKLVKVGTVAIPVIASATIQSRAHAS